jgi:hypothetical protein
VGILIDSSILIAHERSRLDIAAHLEGREDEPSRVTVRSPSTLPGRSRPMDEMTSPATGTDAASGAVGTMTWLRRARDDFAARTASLSPEELVAYVAREAGAARTDRLGTAGATAKSHAPAA